MEEPVVLNDERVVGRSWRTRCPSCEAAPSAMRSTSPSRTSRRGRCAPPRRTLRGARDPGSCGCSRARWRAGRAEARRRLAGRSSRPSGGGARRGTAGVLERLHPGGLDLPHRDSSPVDLLDRATRAVKDSSCPTRRVPRGSARDGPAEISHTGWSAPGARALAEDRRGAHRPWSSGDAGARLRHRPPRGRSTRRSRPARDARRISPPRSGSPARVPGDCRRTGAGSRLRAGRGGPPPASGRV